MAFGNKMAQRKDSLLEVKYDHPIQEIYPVFKKKFVIVNKLVHHNHSYSDCMPGYLELNVHWMIL